MTLGLYKNEMERTQAGSKQIQTARAPQSRQFLAHLALLPAAPSTPATAAHSSRESLEA